jgi:hypothetical protein
MDYRLDRPDVTTDIELEHVRILPCGDVCKFLTTIAHFCWAPTARDYADAQHWINGALLDLAWNNRLSGTAAQVLRMATDLEALPPTLSLHRSGSAAAYLKVRQHEFRLKAQQRTVAQSDVSRDVAAPMTRFGGPEDKRGARGSALS